MLSFTRRHLTAIVLMLACGLVLVMSIVLTLRPTHVPQGLPYVTVETNICLKEDGQTVTMDYGQPCPSGSTQNGTLFIQSPLPTP